MKRLSTLLLTMVATAASAAIYPSSDWFGTNVQKQTTAAGVRAALGITSTGGSATNVYFTSGQSTTPRTVSGSNTFDVTGTLTNYTRNYSAGISNNAADSVNVVFQSANRLVFNDPTGGEQAHYVWGRAGTSLGSQDSFWWNPDLNFSWLSFLSHPFMGVGFNDDRVLIEWNYDESNAITNHIYGTNTSITIDGRYRGAGLSLTSTETNSSLTGGVLAADANGRRKIAALSGLAWDGTTLTASGDGSGLTNVPSKWFDSISAMTNSTPVSNLVVHVWSYFGTNWEGGGLFAWENSSATADLGRVFVGTSGRWRRVDTGYPTNYVFMEHFGVVPNAVMDQYAGAQAAINATPTSEGKLILPDYNFAVGTTLTWTNRRGCYFGTRNAAYVVTPGYRVYPNPTCVIHWVGVSGGTNLVAYDVGHNTFRGFGLDTRIGLNNGDQYTNAAGLLMDVDMNSTHSTTTSANVFDGMYFRERHTNTTLVGLRMASYNWQNCEFFQFYDCYFQGSGGNIPEYWISTTNIGAAKAIQLGGNGGGQNSFGHMMRNCGFNTWQYFVYSAGGSWDIENNYGTAAGVAGYYLNSDDPSYIRGVRDEGDRQFLVSPSVNPVTMEACISAGANGLSVPQIPPVDAVNLIAIGNDFQHEANVPSITNSVNATGWYFGRHNSFDTTNDAQIASWRFTASFDSHGDFGTLNAHNNIQSGPWKTPSSAQTTNLVYQSFTDSATFPTLTLMPSNGAVAIGGAINNVVASVWNSDPLTRTSWQIGDQYENPRVRVVPGSSANSTLFEITANTASQLRIQSSNAIVDVVSGNANNTINFRSGYGKITGTNDTELARFGDGGLDFKIKFPYDTNFEVVGPIQTKALHVTNMAQGVSSALVGWVADTKLLTTQSVTVAGSQIILSGTDGKLLFNNAGGVDFAAWDTLNNQGGTLTTNNATLSGGSFVLTGDGGRGVTNVAVGAGLVVESGVLKTNGQTTAGSSANYGFATNSGAASSYTNAANHIFSGTVAFPGTAVFTGSAIFGGSVTVSNGLPSYFSNLYTTNFTIFSNTPPAAPLTYGEVGFYVSNGVPYVMDSSLSGAHTWLTTNRFGSSPQQVADSLGGLPMNGSGITNIHSTNIVFHFTTLPTLTTNTLVVKNGETYIDADYNVAITNIIIAGQRETLVVSNHSASTIAAFVTTASRKIGGVTSNGIQIAAGKFAYFSFDVNSGKWTNYAAAVEP